GDRGVDVCRRRRCDACEVLLAVGRDDLEGRTALGVSPGSVDEEARRHSRNLDAADTITRLQGALHVLTLVRGNAIAVHAIDSSGALAIIYHRVCDDTRAAGAPNLPILLEQNGAGRTVRPWTRPRR